MKIEIIDPEINKWEEIKLVNFQSGEMTIEEVWEKV